MEVRMYSIFTFLAVCLSLHSEVCSASQRDAEAGPTAVTKVVKLLEEMKEQVAKEADADEEAYKKYACWCENGKKAKTEAISTSETRINDLESTIESSVALEGKLKTEIEELTSDIADDEASLKEATELREKEAAEFKAEEEDMSETLSALSEAVKVLEKVQLLQQKKGAVKDVLAESEGRPLLLQLREAAHQLQPHLNKFRSVMQQDLWDLMGSLGSGSEADASGAFLSRSSLALSQDGASQPTGLVGNAAGAKSYNSRSGSILGMLKQMQDEFSSNLAEARKAEESAAAAFAKLKQAKTAEIAAAKEQKAMKEQALADNAMKLAEAKNDLENTKADLSADQKVLAQLETNCKAEDESYAARSKARGEEMTAIAETIKILMEDDARTLFSKTVAAAAEPASFLQLGRRSSSKVSSAARALSRKQALQAARRRLLSTAREHKNWAMASLAVRVTLAPFTKVKEAMDKMIAELVQQQKDEDAKKDFCVKEIDSAEDSIKESTAEKGRLEDKKLELENTIKALESDLDTLKTEISDLQVSLKQASEDRKAENLVFQQSVSDQRATAQILKKALARLEQYYAAEFVQAGSQQPGEALPAPPQKPSSVEYRKSEGAGGVLQLLNKIISDAEAEQGVLVADEQKAQDDYAALTSDCTESLTAKNAAVAEKTKLKEEATAELSSTEESLLSTGEEIESMEGVLKARHLDCDFLLKYYQTRKEARQEEKEAIAEA
eukprot:CAMPEP_0178442766 /NCGR_PEP_ID=MMETSP0689_2-20121128/38400_1 /TAXON_ID=160604 /ORGANISM="Amphidinium massartii, Strain CS-259" /LENGTH=727 /DNA_ID=CAMNT_0020066455 /DNA_START=15 /DNA_END=2195 /DNA_ORIENTATION=+